MDTAPDSKVEVARQCSPNWVQTSHLRFSGVAAHAMWEAPKTISMPHSVKPRSAFDKCQSELAWLSPKRWKYTPSGSISTDTRVSVGAGCAHCWGQVPGGVALTTVKLREGP